MALAIRINIANDIEVFGIIQQEAWQEFRAQFCASRGAQCRGEIEFEQECAKRVQLIHRVNIGLGFEEAPIGTRPANTV